MARIRSIKPEIAQDAKLATVSRDTRYHFVLLWTVADDEGFFRASPRLLLGQLYPHDSDVNEARVVEMNAALAAIGLLETRVSADGPIGWLVNWNKHQKIDRPSRSHIRESFASPSRDEGVRLAAGVLSPESRVLSPEPPAEASREQPQQPPVELPNGKTPASILAKIKSLAQRREVPGQGSKPFIRTADVQKLGPKTYAAYQAIGGADAVLNTPGEKWSFLVRDFERELKSA